jgi:hypothetical protein
MEKKLAAVNAMLDEKHKPRATHVSSSPHVLLTPAHPVHGQNYIVVCGIWSPSDHSVQLIGNGQDQLTLMFCTVDQATYLLDISIGSCPLGDWQCSRSGPSYGWPAPESLTPQQGHLLFPFIGQGGSFMFKLMPPRAALGSYPWIRAELTKVS